MKNMPIIKTTDTKTGAVQYWRAHVRDWNSFSTEQLLSYGEHAATRKLNEAIATARNWQPRDIYLVALSITDPDEVVDSRLQYRGYENDESPFIIRGKSIGEIEMRGWTDPDGDLRLSFNTSGYSSPSLTATQSAWFHERFGAELAKALNQKLADKVARAYIKYVVDYSKQDVQRLKKQLKEIQNYKAWVNQTPEELVGDCVRLCTDIAGAKGREAVNDLLNEDPRRVERHVCETCTATLRMLGSAHTPHVKIADAGKAIWACCYCGESISRA